MIELLAAKFEVKINKLQHKIFIQWIKNKKKWMVIQYKDIKRNNLFAIIEYMVLVQMQNKDSLYTTFVVEFITT